MIDTLYIEAAVADHPRTREICARYPKARRIDCERYSEVFNPAAQNFRLQKQKPALILASKFKNFVLPAPLSYNIGGQHNYYFSHMLNCLYDCRYCFLQGMYRSANYVLFVNYEDFDRAIIETAQQHKEPAYFFSGYDCDSLALEPVTGFAAHALDTFARHPNAILELRTKSTQIRALLDRPTIDNCVVAFSLSPDSVAQALEHKAPSLSKRLDALGKLQQAGWKIGLRFDPVIYCHNYQTLYADFFRQVFAHIDLERLHSVSLGSFRMPHTFFRNMVRLYPDEKMFAAPLTDTNTMVAYPAEIEQRMLSFCKQELLTHMPKEKLFACTEESI